MAFLRYRKETGTHLLITAATKPINLFRGRDKNIYLNKNTQNFVYLLSENGKWKINCKILFQLKKNYSHPTDCFAVYGLYGRHVKHQTSLIKVGLISFILWPIEPQSRTAVWLITTWNSITKMGSPIFVETLL